MLLARDFVPYEERKKFFSFERDLKLLVEKMFEDDSFD